MSSEDQVTTNILLVDDQPPNLFALEAILEPLGQNLVRANSGSEALKHILKQDFSVILLDVQMPGMDGFETATLIKERERSRHIPIIFLTAISKDERYVFKGYTVGAVDYMFKPFDAEVLRSKVAVFIDLFRKNERVRRLAEQIRVQGERDLADLRRESEHRYRTLAESMPQIVWTADPTGALTYGNRRWFDCAGVSDKSEAPLDFRAVLHPDDTAPFLERWRAGVDAQQTYEAEFRFGSARAGGYRWHLVRALPLRSAGGQVSSWIGTSTDIDDRRRAEDVLRFLADASRVLASSLDHEAALARVARLAVPAVADYCWVDLLEGESTLRRLVTVDSDGEAVEGGGQRWPLDRSASAGSSRVLATRARELLTELPAALLLALTGGAHAPLSIDHATSSICVPVVSRGRALGAITLLTAGSGRTFGPSDLASMEDLALRAGVAVDNATLYALAQRERAKLEEANRAKDEFLATLSHELRTPLNAILGWTHLLRDGQLEGPAATRALETIERNAKAQAQLIADLLDVSRIVTGKLHLSMRPVRLASVVEAALDAVQLSAQAKSIALERALEGASCEVRGDPDRLQQVISNLLSNAVKFTPKGGTIRAVLESLDGRAVVRVIDNGQGILKDFLPFVFDRFRQADSTSTRVHGGLGLGLAIVRHLIELHGGTVSVESEGKGCGASFSVSIPLAEPDDVAVPRSFARGAEAPAQAVPELVSMHVLIVDDDPDGREMLRVVLERRGARVTAVGAAADALGVIGRDRPDMLLCDIGLPGEDGYSLIRRIRELPGGDRDALPAAALTAYASLQDRDRALAAGFQAHLPKPINPDDLMAVLVTFGRHGSVAREAR